MKSRGERKNNFCETEGEMYLRSMTKEKVIRNSEILADESQEIFREKVKF